jgi:RNase P subunit RPR2
MKDNPYMTETEAHLSHKCNGFQKQITALLCDSCGSPLPSTYTWTLAKDDKDTRRQTKTLVVCGNCQHKNERWHGYGLPKEK